VSRRSRHPNPHHEIVPDRFRTLRGMKSKSERSSARTRKLICPKRQARRIRKFAKMLELEPQAFLDMFLDDLIDQLATDNGGTISDFAFDALDYDSPEQERRIKGRVTAYVKSRNGGKMFRSRDGQYAERS
jgi:hypothetical protein